MSETRARFLYWHRIATRWMDEDSYGHVNNAQYYSFIDTTVNRMLIDTAVMRGPHWNAIGLAVASGCEYFAPISFPDQVECGLRIGKIGTTSLRYEVGLFCADREPVCATGYFVHVFVDPSTRRPVPLVDEVRRSMSKLMLAQ